MPGKLIRNNGINDVSLFPRFPAAPYGGVSGGIPAQWCFHKGLFMKKDLFIGIGMVFLAFLCVLDLRTVKNPDIIKNQVGVALFPWLMVGALALLGVILAVSSFVKMKKDRGPSDRKIMNWVRFRSTYAVPLLMFAILSAYIFLTPVIGFYVMSLLFFVGLGLLLGGFNRKNMITVCIGSIVTVLSVYLIFRVMLQVWMPDGLLF